ncbi:hypothetical protein ACFRCG_23855 [Embleya sp. NPDC056575]|uniref:hypothetical protein n=1 Tax=unclassified Embleya TaxID=2699296 RepID=UPI003691F556
MFRRIKSWWGRRGSSSWSTCTVGEMQALLAWAVTDAARCVRVDGSVTVTSPGTLQSQLLRAIEGVAYAHALLEHHALQADLLQVGPAFVANLEDAHSTLYSALDAVRRVAMLTAVPDQDDAGPGGPEAPPVPAAPVAPGVSGVLRLGPFVPPIDPFSKS